MTERDCLDRLLSIERELRKPREKSQFSSTREALIDAKWRLRESLEEGLRERPVGEDDSSVVIDI